MNPSLRACLGGTFLLRFSSGLTAALLVFYLADLPRYGGPAVSPLIVGVLTAAFFVAEVSLSPLFGALSDRFGHHLLMQLGPLLGAVAVVMTALSTDLAVLGATRLLEGAAAAVSVPSILAYLALSTATDERLRGRVSAAFEAVTVAGLGGGIAAAGVVWTILGQTAFYANAVLYLAALVVYRIGVSRPRLASGQACETTPVGRVGYRILLSNSRVWLLAPTWMAINAALGLYTSQTLFQLVRAPDPRFSDQLMVGGFSPLEVTLGFAVGICVFFAGLAYWGRRFAHLRRTTIFAYGIAGGGLMALAALALNHSGDVDAVYRAPLALVGLVGLFVLAGATPAALGLLADMSEAFPADRG
ncbi:MAG: MFS transporter, partial [Chloroflexi bacterium]|nr:MFS transporter [Chloroflexota bacterium]